MAKPITFEIDNEPHLVTLHDAAIIGSCKQIRVERPAQFEILYLRASLIDLWNQFEKLTARHHRGSLSFNRTANVCNTKGKGIEEIYCGAAEKWKTDYPGDSFCDDFGHCRSGRLIRRRRSS
jgi:hypothetical protein